MLKPYTRQAALPNAPNQKSEPKAPKNSILRLAPLKEALRILVKTTKQARVAS